MHKQHWSVLVDLLSGPQNESPTMTMFDQSTLSDSSIIRLLNYNDMMMMRQQVNIRDKTEKAQPKHA